LRLARRPFLCDTGYPVRRATYPDDRIWTSILGEVPFARGTPRRPYSVLLPVGFAVPPALPHARCALTAPFHPYHRVAGMAVCSLWHFPWARARRTLSGTVCPWSPDFPLEPPFGIGPSSRPAD